MAQWCDVAGTYGRTLPSNGVKPLVEVGLDERSPSQGLHVDTIGTHTAVLDIAFIKHVEGASGGHPPGTAAGLAADDTAGYKDTRDSRDEEGQHLSSYRESLPEARNHGQNASRVSRPLIRQPCQAAADDLRGVLRCCGPARCGVG